MFCKNIKKKTGGHGGFTLLEVLISMLVLTIGLLGIAAMHISAIKGNYTAKEMSDASNMGLNNFEQLLGASYGDISHTYEPDPVNAPGVLAYPPCYDDAGTLSSANQLDDKYWVCYEIVENDDDPAIIEGEEPGAGTGTKTVTAHIMWYDETGCKDDNPDDVIGCDKTHPILKFRFNMERNTKYIIPRIDR